LQTKALVTSLWCDTRKEWHVFTISFFIAFSDYLNIWILCYWRSFRKFSQILNLIFEQVNSVVSYIWILICLYKTNYCTSKWFWMIMLSGGWRWEHYGVWLFVMFWSQFPLLAVYSWLFLNLFGKQNENSIIWVLHCICHPIVECWWSVQKVSHPCVAHLHVNKKYFFNRTPVEEYYACVVRVSLSNGRVFDTPTLEDREMLRFIGCW
jgi:hypothetical protein